MPYIKVIDETIASNELKNIYEKIKSARGKISNIMKIHSLMPDTMIKHLELYMAIMFSKTNLTREEKEILAVAVSKINNCDYCIKHHAEALNNYWKNETRLNQFIFNLDDPLFSAKFKLTVNHVIKLTSDPATVKNLKLMN